MTAAPPPRASRVAASISVVLCTYKRPDDLARCLRAVEQQTRTPDEVLVVVRDTDDATRNYLAHRVPSSVPDPLPLRVVLVQKPGTVAARNAGLFASTSDVVSMTDDDAVPRPDWVERILEHFRANPRLGALGGRDQCFTAAGLPQPASKDVVGRLLWNGKHVGNHALGRGGPREVDLLKGVNMSFRREAATPIGFDLRLRGSGAQPSEDLALSRAVSVRGWSVLYDPAVLVDHYEGVREEPRHYAALLASDQSGLGDAIYNQFVATWDGRSPLQHLVSLLYFFVVGTRFAPGLVQALRFTPSLGRVSWMRFAVAQRARLEAFWNLSRASASPSGNSATPLA